MAITMIGQTISHYQIPIEIEDINRVEGAGFMPLGLPEEGAPKTRIELKRLNGDESMELGPRVSSGKRRFNDSASLRAPPVPAVRGPR
jgi:hypothetical protein